MKLVNYFLSLSGMYVMFTEVTNVKSRSPPQLLQWTDEKTPG